MRKIFFILFIFSLLFSANLFAVTSTASVEEVCSKNFNGATYFAKGNYCLCSDGTTQIPLQGNGTYLSGISCNSSQPPVQVTPSESIPQAGNVTISLACQTSAYHEALNNAESCKEIHETAVNDCDAEGQKSLGATGSLGNLTNMMGTLTSTSGQMACSKMGKLTQAATASLAVFKVMCSKAMDDCKDVCSPALSQLNRVINDLNLRPNCATDAVSLKKYKKDIEALANSCRGKEQAIAQADASVKQLATTYMQSRQCADQLAATTTNVCDTYPDIAGCKNRDVDCSLAENASTVTCICQKNARDPICTAAIGSNNGLNPSGTGSGGSFATQSASRGKANTNLSNSPFGGGMGGGLDSLGAGAGSRAASSNGTGQGGNSSLLDGGQDGSGGSGSRAAAMANADADTSVRGGRGGGGYSIPSGSGGSEDGFGVHGGYSAGGIRGGGSGIDLKKYLPGGAYDPKRRVAGSVGPDGITCATCLSLFEKITIRYNAVKGQLTPD